MKARVDRFLREFSGWSSGQADIQAASLVGSYARDAATDTSDVDLLIIADHPETYLQNRDWAAQFGRIDRIQVEDYGRVTSLRVWYDDQLEVEYGLTDRSWAEPLDEGSRKVISDGIRVLFERAGLLSRHQSSARQ